MSHATPQATPSDRLHDPHRPGEPINLGQKHEPHAMPLSVLFGVFVLLLVLTFLTVAVTWIDLGGINIWVAMAVAVVKAAFVGLYFMHLRYDAPFNGLILLFAMVFVALFIGFALMDSLEYQPEMDEPVIVQSAG